MRTTLAATLLLGALAACGKVETITPNDSTGGSDGSVDAPASGMVSVTLLDPNGSGAPVVGAQIVFTDSESTQRSATDGSGVATAFMTSGGTVTAVGPGFGGEAALLQTVFGVKPGDAIVLGVAVTPSTSLQAFTVGFTPVGGLGSASANYAVFGPCGESTTTAAPGATSAAVTLTFSDDCLVDPMEFVVVGTNAATGAPLGYLDKTGVSYAPNGSTMITGAFQPLISFTGEYSDGSAVDELEMNRFAPDQFGYESGANTNIDASGDAAPSVTGPVSASAIVESQLSRTGFGAQQILEHVPGNATSYTLDLGQAAMPWIGPPTFDQATLTMHVPVATDGAGTAPIDLFNVQLSYSRASADGGPIREITWLAFAGAAGDLTMPPLPGDLGDLLPLATDTLGGTSCGEFDSDALAGYDQGRLAPYTLPAAEEVRGVTGRRRFAFADDAVSPAATAGSRGRWSRPLVRRGAARAR